MGDVFVSCRRKFGRVEFFVVSRFFRNFPPPVSLLNLNIFQSVIPQLRV